MKSFENLVDQIYQAATEPDIWPSVLHDISQTVDAQGGILLTRRADNWIGWRYSPNFPRGMDAYLVSDAAFRSQTTPRLLGLNYPGFITEREVFTDEEFLADTYMTEWGVQAGTHHATVTAIQIPTGDFVVVQFNRRTGQESMNRDDLTRLDALRPHLARSGLLAARWRLGQLRAAVEALDLVGLPAAILDFTGNVVATNKLIEEMSSSVVWLPKDRVALADRAADNLLQHAVMHLRTPAATSVRSIPMHDRVTGKSTIVHLIPITGRARDLFGGGFGILIVTPVSTLAPIDTTLLQGLFDLTPSEAKVANGFAEGMNIDQMAVRYAVKRETIRAQTKAVFAKTGTNRQAQLASLLVGLPRMRDR